MEQFALCPVTTAYQLLPFTELESGRTH